MGRNLEYGGVAPRPVMLNLAERMEQVLNIDKASCACPMVQQCGHAW